MSALTGVSDAAIGTPAGFRSQFPMLVWTLPSPACWPR